MKSTTPLLILTILMFRISGIQSQDLHIQRGDKTMTFKAGYLIRIDKPNLIYPECKSCPNEYMIGRLVSFSNDTLLLRLKVHNIAASEDGKDIGAKSIVYKDKMEKEWPLVKIPSSLILALTKQGKKDWQPESTGDLAGGTLAFLGLLDLYAAWVAEDEKNSDVLTGVGATSTGLGLIMIAVFDRKTYYINNPINKKNKTWSIKA